jgi:hypothetical protein
MKRSLPIFSLVIAASLAAGAQGQSPTSVAGQGGGAVAEPAGSGVQDADALVEQVQRSLDGLRSLAAKVRSEGDLFDHPTTGAGIYLQQGRGLRQLSRLEIKNQIGDSAFTLLEINDGRSFWTFRELPAGPTISKLDLDRIESQLRAPGLTSGSPAVPPIAGLPKLLFGLRQNFHFTRAAETQLGERPLWVIDGQWRPERLIAAVPDQRGTIEAGRTIELKKLPAHLPEHVLIYVGKADWIPYRIEYLRRGNKNDGAGQGSLLPGYQTIASTEYFDIRINVPIDQREFVYQPSGLTQPKGTTVIDVTDAYLKTLTGEGAK